MSSQPNLGPDSDPGMIEVTGRILSETETGIKFDDGLKTVWLPKKKIKIIGVVAGEFRAISMPLWLARENRYA